MLPEEGLSRRETEVMAIVHGLGSATAAQVRAEMREPPTDAAVRSTLRILVEKGHLRFESTGQRYVYFPTVPREDAARSALENVLDVFFDGSPEGAMAALLEMDGGLTAEQRSRLRALIDRAEEAGR